MKKNIAAGVDGFPIEFYQACCPFIKDDIMMCFYEFHAGKLDMNRINFGIITLIPKGVDADTIQKYRAICLLPVLLKIFSKGMDERVKPFMHKLIYVCQNAFIKRRNIMDGVMSLHEILHESKKKQQGVVLKLAFEKAYDKVNWDFMFHILRERGFSET